MNPRDFHRCALNLANSNSAADLRSAISRAYYAAYLVSLEIMEKMGFPRSDFSRNHGTVRYYLSNSGNTDCKRASTRLSDLHTKRIHADYQMHRNDVENRKTVQALVRQALEVIQTLERCNSGPDRERIINGIKDYKRKISGTVS